MNQIANTIFFGQFKLVELMPLFIFESHVDLSIHPSSPIGKLEDIEHKSQC